MNTYTTKSGLQIGGFYIKPAMPVQGDALLIQAALLGKPANKSTLGDKVVCWTVLFGLVVAVYVGWKL